MPFVLSIPHRGTEFPDELKDKYVPEFQEVLDDTDWFLEKLYDFAPELGITTIYAKYSRWVIDLNREPKANRFMMTEELSPHFARRPIFSAKIFISKKNLNLTMRKLKGDLKIIIVLIIGKLMKLSMN